MWGDMMARKGACKLIYLVFLLLYSFFIYFFLFAVDRCIPKWTVIRQQLDTRAAGSHFGRRNLVRKTKKERKEEREEEKRTRMKKQENFYLIKYAAFGESWSRIATSTAGMFTRASEEGGWEKKERREERGRGREGRRGEKQPET